MTKKTTKRNSRKVIAKLPTSNQRTKVAKLWHDASVVRKLYEQDGKSQSEIAAELGCSLMTISKAFKKHGIKTKRGRRPGSKSKTIASRRANVSNARIAGRATSPDGVRKQINELTAVMDRLGPHARAAVKKDLHDLIDRL